MNLDDYIDYVLKYGLISDRLWHTSLLGIRSGDTDNKYVRIEDNKCYLIVNGSDVAWSGYVPGKGILKISDVVNISSDSMESLSKNIKTTLGRIIVNYVLIEFPYSGKLEYIDGDISHSDFINVTKNALSNDVIDVNEYMVFVKACTYLEELNKVYTPSSTEKLVSPPPGIDKFKTELKKEYVAKYGPEWSSDPARVIEYDKSLKKYYSDYISDDPSNGIMANDKNKNNALAKRYLTFGTTNAFGEQVHVDDSLSDGYPDDPEKLSAIFNTIRDASYSRGNETQKGGSVAKSVLRATSSMRVESDDCGSITGKRINADTSIINNYLGRFMLVNKKPIEITKDNISDIVGRDIVIRSPMYCIARAPTICKTCMGTMASGKPNGISLIVTNISSIITTAALKSMHNSSMSSVKMDLDKVIT